MKKQDIYKRRRGTGIIKTPKGIILVKERDTYYLPGGGASRNESRHKAFLREIEEELQIKHDSAEYLFKHRGSIKHSHGKNRLFRDHAKIFEISTTQQPIPSHEIKGIIHYKKGMNIPIEKDTQKILNKYFRMKK